MLGAGSGKFYVGAWGLPAIFINAGVTDVCCCKEDEALSPFFSPGYTCIPQGPTPWVHTGLPDGLCSLRKTQSMVSSCGAWHMQADSIYVLLRSQFPFPGIPSGQYRLLVTAGLTESCGGMLEGSLNNAIGNEVCPKQQECPSTHRASNQAYPPSGGSVGWS